MHYFRPIGLVLLLLSTIVLSILIWKSEAQKRILKQDIIELSKVKYGLFNVDEWKSILAEIISKKIDQFNFNKENRDEMEVKVSDFLHKAINEFEQNFKQTNRKQSWFGISYKNVIANSVSLFTRLRENVPELTNQIITYLDDPENRQNLKQYINKKIGEYADETFSQMDYSHLNSILAAHQYENRIEALDGLQQQIGTIDNQNIIIRYSLISLILIQTIGLIFSRRLTKLEITLFTGLAFTVLCLGLSLPMIDIDARISEMSFTLLGEKIKYNRAIKTTRKHCFKLRYPHHQPIHFTIRLLHVHLLCGDQFIDISEDTPPVTYIVTLSEYLGNVPELLERRYYPDLEEVQGGLF
ncbi:MAG: hypothetical protein RIM99_08040 [Cyclobacteriaceae bacterium]